MGYRRTPKAYRLKFEDPDLAGLEVTVRSLPIGEFLKLSEFATLHADDPGAAAKGATEMFRVLAASLLTWNLEDEFGDPVPATYDGIIGQELDFVMQIITAWVSAMTDVAPPLPPGSSAGATSALEQSLPMAPLSPSHPS